MWFSNVDLIDAWGCSISANTFTIIAQRALVIGSGSGRIAVTGNNFSNSYIGGQERRAETPSPATGILMQNTSDVAVSGNIFTGLAQQAVIIEGECLRVLVDGNVFADLGREIVGEPTAFAHGNVADVIIGDNAIEKGFELRSQDE